MITKLPKWIELGGFLLALCAGCVNAVALLGFKHESVSHLSGASTALAEATVQSNFAQASHLLLAILCFVLGSVLSSLIVGNESLQLGRPYDAALVVEAGLLVAATIFYDYGSNVGHYFASAACGLQNAMGTAFSGAVVRTTHVTGLFTDLGLAIGAMLRGEPQIRRKIQLFLLLIGGFLCGGALGAYLFQFYAYNAILVPAGLCISMATVYRILRRSETVAK